MVRFHNQTHTHPYPFETVTLAYYLRYPNPYSTHVLSTDVVSRHYDPSTQTLHTARLHLKRSKIPAALLKLLPTSWLGAGADGSSQSYILERSIVDVRSGVMVTESRNLELTGVLTVVERQLYRRPGSDLVRFFRESYNYGKTCGAGNGDGGRDGRGAEMEGVFKLKPPGWRHLSGPVEGMDGGETEVSTKVELVSRLGEAGPKRRLWSRGKTQPQQQSEEAEEQQPKEKMGFFRSWSTSSIQRSIEAIGLRRTERAVPNSKKGMNVVLERLRSGGLVAVLEGMRRDKEMAFAAGKGRIRGSDDE